MDACPSRFVEFLDAFLLADLQIMMLCTRLMMMIYELYFA